MRVPVIGALIAMAAASALAAPPSASTEHGVPSPYRIVDAVDLSDRASWLRHRATMGGGWVVRERVGVGALLLPVAGARLTPGGSLHVRLARDGGDESLVLTMSTAPRDYGRVQSYRVLIDGTEAMRVTEPDPGGGVTRSFFLPLPRTRSRSVGVRVVADSGTPAPITVSSLCVVSGLSLGASTDLRDPRLRVGIALLTSKAIGYAIDQDEVARIRELSPRSECIVPQAAVLYNFAKRDSAANAQEVDRLADLAVATGVPIRIAFQFHWAGIPSGVPDGAGGTFTDLPYQMVTFDPGNRVRSPELVALMGDAYDERFGLSVPNRWGNTPWLTFNHPRLDQLYRARIQQALAAWVAARSRLAEKGKADLLPGELSTGDETIYWAKGVDDSAYTAANGGRPRLDLSADFNPYTVADALRDHIGLDPRNGLSGPERWWLHQNMGRRQQRIVDWMLGALPAEPVRMAPDGPVFAHDLVRRNVFTEPYAMPCFPMKDLSPHHPGLEVGYVRDGRSGGGYWSGATMLPWLLKARERGRVALPNLECTGADDPQLLACLRAAYACGSRFMTLYNWHHRETARTVLADFARSIARIPWLTFPPALPTAPTDAAAGSEARDATPVRAAAPPGAARALSREWRAGPGAFGVNCVELFATEPMRDESVRVEVTEVDGPRRTAVVVRATVAHAGDVVRVYLPAPFALQPGQQYRVSVGPGSARACRIAAGEDGGLAVRLAMDIVAERRRSLVVGDVQDTRDIVDSVARSHGRGMGTPAAVARLAQARTLLRQGDPVGAYAAAVCAEQLTLPASFELAPPGGRLTPYRVRVACSAAPVRVTLLSAEARSLRVRVVTAAAQDVTISWRGSATTASLAPSVPAEIELVRRDAGVPRGAGVRRRSRRR